MKSHWLNCFVQATLLPNSISEKQAKQELWQFDNKLYVRVAYAPGIKRKQSSGSKLENLVWKYSAVSIKNNEQKQCINRRGLFVPNTDNGIETSITASQNGNASKISRIRDRSLFIWWRESREAFPFWCPCNCN